MCQCLQSPNSYYVFDRCGPCKQIAPIYKELSNEFGSRANFIKVDVDDNPEAAQKYGVSAMPTFLFIKGGEVVDRLMGANSDRLKEVRTCYVLFYYEFVLCYLHVLTSDCFITAYSRVVFLKLYVWLNLSLFWEVVYLSRM